MAIDLARLGGRWEGGSLFAVSGSVWEEKPKKESGGCLRGGGEEEEEMKGSGGEGGINTRFEGREWSLIVRAEQRLEQRGEAG